MQQPRRPSPLLNKHQLHRRSKRKLDSDKRLEKLVSSTGRSRTSRIGFDDSFTMVIPAGAGGAFSMDNIIRNIHYSPPIHVSRCLLSLYVLVARIPPSYTPHRLPPPSIPPHIHALFSFFHFMPPTSSSLAVLTPRIASPRTRPSDATTFVTSKTRKSDSRPSRASRERTRRELTRMTTLRPMDRADHRQAPTQDCERRLEAPLATRFLTDAFLHTRQYWV